MSKVITPPDQINDPNSYLIVNAVPTDIELVVRWLRFSGKDYTIHLYHDGMNNSQWLSEVARQCGKILINRNNTEPKGLIPLYEALGKIVWFGLDQNYLSPIEYFSKNG